VGWLGSQYHLHYNSNVVRSDFASCTSCNTLTILSDQITALCMTCTRVLHSAPPAQFQQPHYNRFGIMHDLHYMNNCVGRECASCSVVFCTAFRQAELHFQLCARDASVVCLCGEWADLMFTSHLHSINKRVRVHICILQYHVEHRFAFFLFQKWRKKASAAHRLAGPQVSWARNFMYKIIMILFLGNH